MTCDYKINPAAIDTPHPLLAWELESNLRGTLQAKYRIVASTSPELLENGIYDAYDTGEIRSSETSAEYNGRFETGEEYFWRVTVYDNHGNCAMSPVASFGAGLLTEADWEGAVFISASDDPVQTRRNKERLRYEVSCCFSLKQSAFGLIFGTVDSDNFYMWQYSEADLLKNEKVVLLPHIFKNGDPECLDSVDLSGVIPWNERYLPHSIRIQVDGSKVTTLIDNKEVDVRTGLPFTGYGILGFRQNNGRDGRHEQAEVLSLAAFDDTAIIFSSDFDEPECRQFGSGQRENGHLLVGYDFNEFYWQTDGAALPFLRKDFITEEKKIRKAKLYSSALGLYELYINGNRVGDEYFAPGWTDYNKRVQYQCYDVAEYIQSGANNAWGVMLAPGWYSGRLGIAADQMYGYGSAFIGKLVIEYTDGTKDTHISDFFWRCYNDGPLIYSDMLDGECYDGRKSIGRHPNDWATTDFSFNNWKHVFVRCSKADKKNLVAQSDPPVRETGILDAINHWEKDGKILVDFGQNFAGVVRLTMKGVTGTRIVLRYGEVLESGRSLHTINLRSAKATDCYILKGHETETFQPKFTFHGFRYAEITGIAFSDFNPADIKGVVYASDLRITGYFTCSNDMVNRLYKNIEWGQRGNFLSIPTDCPQRDERRGWTGDAEVFVRTGCYIMDSMAFYRKFTIDMRDSQRGDGAVPDVVPAMGNGGAGNAAWGDAIVIVPFTLYGQYGDLSVLLENYDAMKAWVEYYRSISHQLIVPDCAFGDWLSVGEVTEKNIVATAFFAYSTELFVKSAKALYAKTDKLKYKTDADEYGELWEMIRYVYNNTFIDPVTGVCGNDTQGSYVLSLCFNLVPNYLKQKAADHLANNITEKHGGHLTTGFVSVGRLCPVLSDNGYTELAYKLLTNTTYPSWGYSVERGATTIWERWNSCLDDGSIDPALAGMNSLNHYSLGAVGEWIYRYVLGIETAAKGFSEFILKPEPVYLPEINMTSACGSYHSMNGEIRSSWHYEDDTLIYEASIPAGTKATLFLPAAKDDIVYEGLTLAGAAESVDFVEAASGKSVYNLKSGNYRFAVYNKQTENNLLKLKNYEDKTNRSNPLIVK